MAIDIGPKIGIEGEAQYRKELQQIIQGQKTLAAEAKAVSAAMQDETDAEKKAAAEKDVLTRQISNQREKLAKLEEGLIASARKYGEADTRTQKWQQAVYNATGELATMELRLKTSDNQVEEITQDMGEAERATSGWGEVLKGSLAAEAVKKGLSFIRDAVSGIAGKTFEAAKAGAAYADTYATMAAESGLSTDALQEYAYMADLVDVSVETLVGAQSKLINSMRGARDGTGAAAEAWQALGIQIEGADGELRSAEDVMQETLQALGKMENSTERDAAAMAIFGKSAQELNPLIKTGADRIAELRKEAHDTGYVLSGSALTALNRQQDAMDKLGNRVEAVSNKFAAKLAPGITKGAEALDQAFDNPRVKRGLDVMAEGIGKATSGVMELAADALPKLFQVLNFGDVELRLFTDEQLDLVNRLEETKQAHDEMVASFKENAKGIVAETERTEGLWKELQKLVGENGEVKKADEERVNFINSQLKEALGVQMELEDGILQGYVDQKNAIDDLIKQREAEALLAAATADFADAEQRKNEALAEAAQLYPQIAEREKALQKAQENLNEARESYRNTPGYAYQGEQYVAGMTVQYENAVRAQEQALQRIQERYEEANGEVRKYYAELDIWQQAQSAAANGNYKEVVRLLTNEFAVTLEYYREKKTLNDKERADLKGKIREAELNIAEYKRNLEAGLQGFSEAGLQEMEDYVADAKGILNGQDIGESFLDGIERGLRDETKKAQIAAAAAAVASTVQRQTKTILMIASPSKVATWMGEMWDEGLIQGLIKRKNDVTEAAGLVAGAFVGPAQTSLKTSSYTPGTTLTPLTSGAGGGTSGNSIRIGTIPISVTTQGPVDVRSLAAAISVQLSDTLRQAQRGGRI